MPKIDYAAQLRAMPENELLARVLWGEARGEGEAGMAAVACVVMTRVSHPRWWGGDVRSVLLQPYQFSCLLPTDPNLPKLATVTDKDPAFRLARDVAARALSGTLEDTTSGADHYLVTSIRAKTKWARDREPVAVIGCHSFFRLEAPAPQPVSKKTIAAGGAVGLASLGGAVSVSDLSSQISDLTALGVQVRGLLALLPGGALGMALLAALALAGAVWLYQRHRERAA